MACWTPQKSFDVLLRGLGVRANSPSKACQRLKRVSKAEIGLTRACQRPKCPAQASTGRKGEFGFALGDYAPGANFNLVLIFEIVYNLFNQAAVLWRVELAKKIFTFCFGDYACAPTALPRLAKGSNVLQKLKLALPGLAKGQNALHKLPLAAKENLGFALGDYAPRVNFNPVLIFEIVFNLFDLGLLEPSGNYNLAVKWPLWLQTWTWAFWGLLAITIWLWNGHFGSKCGPGPFEAFWQLQFGCEMAILAPNLDLGLLEPSGNYNLAMKWQFLFQIWTWAFWSLLAITHGV